MLNNPLPRGGAGPRLREAWSCSAVAEVTGLLCEMQVLAVDFKLLKNKLRVLTNPARAPFLRRGEALAKAASPPALAEPARVPQPLGLGQPPSASLVRQLHEFAGLAGAGRSTVFPGAAVAAAAVIES